MTAKTRVKKVMLVGVAGLLLSLSACGGSSRAGGGGTGVEKMSFRCATEGPVGNIAQISLQKWSDLLAKKSGGKVSMKVFPGGQLMTDQAAVQALASGALECDASVPAWITQLVPDATVLDVPYVFSSPDQAAGWKSPLAKALNAELQKKNVTGLSAWSVGPTAFGAKKPITGAADFDGLKIRAAGSQPTIDALKALGAQPVTLSATEVATAVSTGAVDVVQGAEQYWASQFPEQLKYAFVSKIFSTVFGVWVSYSWFEGLNAATQDLLTSTLQTVTDEAGPEVTKLTDDSVTKAEAAGATVHVASASEEAAIRQTVNSVRSKALAQYPSAIQRAVASMAGQ